MFFGKLLNRYRYPETFLINSRSYEEDLSYARELESIRTELKALQIEEARHPHRTHVKLKLRQLRQQLAVVEKERARYNGTPLKQRTKGMK